MNMSRHLFIVPSKNRDAHEKQFLKEFCEYLNIENIKDYKILLLYQNNTKPFNLGWNINVGFDLFDKDNFDLEFDVDSEDSIIFHPVDGCPVSLNSFPRNKMISSYMRGYPIDLYRFDDDTVNELNEIYKQYKVTSHTMFNVKQDEIVTFAPRFTYFEVTEQKNITRITTDYGEYYKALGLGRDAYKKINGHTNLLYGWGAEDDDFLMRIQKAPDVKLRRLPVIWNWYYNSVAEHGDILHADKMKEIYDNPNFTSQNSGLNTLSYTSKIIKLDKNVYRVIIDEL